jgi:hypothetical protein
MLLHGDGTNGAQNNTFLDSSTNAFSITRNGNTTQGSFSPYGSNWSNFFAGSDYLTLASNTAFNIFNGDMTVECWFNATSLTNSPHLLAFVQDASNRESIYFNSGALTFYSSSGAGSGNRIATATISTGVWYHYALVKSGSTFTAYLNGVSVGTSTTTQYSTANQSLQIGTYDSGSFAGDNFNGYMSNVRVVKGTAVYTSNFTPSTTPLTAITNTSLLTCQSNRFIDNSASPLTITPTATSVQRFNPFGASTAYSTSVIGGSGYFDYNGSYLGCGSQSAYAFGTSNFTVECWAYATSFGSYNSLTGSRSNSSDGSNTNYSFGIDSGGSVYFYSGSFLVTSSAGAIKLNSWNHVALVRSGTSTNQSVLYINGVSAGTGTISNNLSGTSVAIGGLLNGNELFNGYITNVRLNNTALYSTTFTPPTAPLTAVSGTSLLTNFTNGAIFDNAMMNDLETVGNAQISTSVVKYGTGSIALDGTGDYLLTRSTPNLAFGSGNFTIECWAYATSLGSYNALFAQWPDNGGSANNSYVLESVGSTMYFYWVSGTTLYGPATLGTITTGSWIHWAICRGGNTLYPFKDGVLGTTISISQTLNSPTSNVTVGGAVAGGGEWIGYIDELRITKGYARYTANFTPPTEAFLNIGPN